MGKFRYVLSLSTPKQKSTEQSKIFCLCKKQHQTVASASNEFSKYITRLLPDRWKEMLRLEIDWELDTWPQRADRSMGTPELNGYIDRIFTRTDTSVHISTMC